MKGLEEKPIIHGTEDPLLIAAVSGESCWTEESGDECAEGGGTEERPDTLKLLTRPVRARCSRVIY